MGYYQISFLLQLLIFGYNYFKIFWLIFQIGLKIYSIILPPKLKLSLRKHIWQQPFCEFFKNKNLNNIENFSQQVLEELLKTKQEIKTFNAFLDIEPIQVIEEKKETKLHNILIYKGEFIYVFNKQGIFLDSPNDFATQIERKPNINGQIEFYINKQTQKIDYIHETFAENKYGRLITDFSLGNISKEIGKRILSILLIPFLIIVILLLLKILVEFLIYIPK